MFEREADLAETEMLIHCHGDYSKKKNYREGWQEGATFGYSKANEWHYVKDKLPEEDVYVYLLCKKDNYPVFARRHIFYGETEWKWDCKWGSSFQLKADNEKIIAWKEIVLPKEIKENDL